MPLHRRMQIENLNKKLWPRVQNKLKKRRWMELCLAVGLAKHSSGALLLCDGRENCGCDRLRRCYCCSSTISKSITQRKKIYNPSIWPLWKMIQFDQSIEKKTVQMLLKGGRIVVWGTKGQHVKIHHHRLPSCKSLRSANKAGVTEDRTKRSFGWTCFQFKLGDVIFAPQQDIVSFNFSQQKQVNLQPSPHLAE